MFPLIGIGSSLGAWVEIAIRAGTLIEQGGPWRLLRRRRGDPRHLRRAGGLRRSADRPSGRRTARAGARERLPDGQSGFRMILSDRYLLLIAVLVLLLNVVNTSGGYLFDRVRHGDGRRAI